MQNEDMKGFLKKLKTSKLGRLFGNTNTRWFECLFKERLFGYKDKTTDLKLRSTIKFEEITDFSSRLTLEDSKLCDWKYGFQIITKDRIYILFCQDKESLDKWTIAFNTILKRGPKKLAVIETPNFSALKPKQEQPKKVFDESLKRSNENTHTTQKEVMLNNELKREENKLTEIKAPQSVNRQKSAIVVDEEEIIDVKQEENKEEKPSLKKNKPNLKMAPHNYLKQSNTVVIDDNINEAKQEENKEEKPVLIREEYKAERPKHVRNYIPQLANNKADLKTANLKDEYDENIINLIDEADRSFDNITVNTINNKDKYYRQNKKNVRSSSAINVENHGPTSIILKTLLEKEQNKKAEAALVSKEINDWNYYDNEGNLVQQEENPYNPATANEGTKEQREEKRKKKAIANLLLGGVHLGIESDEELDKSTNNLKNVKRDSNTSIMKLNCSNLNGQSLQTNKDQNVYDIFVENKFIKSEINFEDSEKQKSFIPKSILSNIVLYDNKKQNNVTSNKSENLSNKIKIEGLEHPEIKRTTYIIDTEKETEEISKFFNENRNDIHETIYDKNNESKIIKVPVIKTFKNLENEFEELDYHNQKQTVSKSNKVVLKKPTSNKSNLHKSKNTTNDPNQQNNPLNSSNLMGEIAAFDSNPQLSNNIMLNNDNIKQIDMNRGLNKPNERNNMNSSFVEDLTDDW